MRGRRERYVTALALVLFLLAPSVHADVKASTKFIPTLLVYYGGGPPLTAADAPRLARYDLIDIDRFRYSQMGPGAWAAVKSYNANVEIYLYEMSVETPNYMDTTPVSMLNGLGRYDISRGHPMGSLNGDHPEFFLTDAAGFRIFSRNFSNPSASQYWYLMDFGNASYQYYWVRAVKADIVDQPWVADGVFADNCLTCVASGGYSGVPFRYSTDVDWSTAMNRFASGIAQGLHGYGQKLWCNKGDTRSPAGALAWRNLDASVERPDVLMEEGAFAVAWGPSAVQFFSEAQWKNQVDTISATTNTKVALLSHTQLAADNAGVDNFGRSANFWQILYYAMGSMLLAKSELNNAYLMFSGGANFSQLVWYDEYDRIDLGKPIGSYRIATPFGVNVYYREFERGYVVVNPTPDDVPWLPTPPVRPITHDNLLQARQGVPVVESIVLHAHSAAILEKAITPAPVVVPPPDPLPIAPPAEYE